MGIKKTLTATLIVSLFACTEPSTPFGDQSGTSGRTKPAELQGTLHATLGTDWADFDRASSTVKPWTGGHEQRRCTDMFACGLLLSKVKVQIQANPESMFADSTDVGTYGTILMKLVNTGNRRTAAFAEFFNLMNTVNFGNSYVGNARSPLFRQPNALAVGLGGPFRAQFGSRFLF